MRVKCFKSKKLNKLLIGMLLAIIVIICVLFKINSNDKIEKTIGAIDNDGYLNEEEVTNETNGQNPYIPEGYTQVEGTSLDNGFTIQEESTGNQYVWIEVPRTEEVYPTAGLEITKFTTEEYTAIENDLHTYTDVYRNGTTYTDTYYSDATTGLIEIQYLELKHKMLKSIYQYEGFYIGKYETGIEGAPRTSGLSSTTPTQTPVIKQNAYPYNYVTCKQAQKLASGFASQLHGYTSSLMFGVQWDLVLKYLETKGVTQDELKKDSTNWGNYYNNNWTISNENSKYSTNGTSWTSGAYGAKTADASILLSTGASDDFCKQGIYDLAGNVYEWTLESSSINNAPCAERGGDYQYDGSSHPANYRNFVGTSGYYKYIGFRVSLYKEEITEPYIPIGYTQVEGTSLANGLTIEEESTGNQYVWVEVPQIATVYPTAGLNITEFTPDEYTAIENDLRTYTSTYSSTSYKDEYYSDDTTGLTEADYNELKQKMLKSVYQNGGFYVGKYETGIESSYRTQETTGITEKAVIKQNAYPYNCVTCSQAQTLASGFASQGYTSSLMFGVQWDLIMKYLENKAVEQGTELATIQSELTSKSTNWGNYVDNNWIIYNRNSKYSIYGTSWTSGLYNGTGIKDSTSQRILLSTGASDDFSKQGIYDLAGNVFELTLEHYDSNEVASRGGVYFSSGSTQPAVFRMHTKSSTFVERIWLPCLTL